MAAGAASAPGGAGPGKGGRAPGGTAKGKKADRHVTSAGMREDVVVFVMQLACLSLAVSLFMTGLLLACVAAGVRDRTTVGLVVLTSYASLGAIGAVVVGLLVLNLLHTSAQDD